MQVFVAGATGETGRRIVQALVRRQIPVRAGVRNLDLARQILPPEAELVFLDVTQQATLAPALGNSTALICATGARPSLEISGPWAVDCCGVQNLVDAARLAKVRHFVLVSSLCVSQFFHPLNLFWLILYWKRQGEIYLEDSGLPYTIVRPGGLLNAENTEPLVMQGPDTLFEGRIPRTRVAEVCVEALFQPAARHKIVEIVTQAGRPNLTWEQLFAQV